MKEYKAKTVDQAIQIGLEDMGLTRDNADITVVCEGGFLKKATVQISPKEQECEESEQETCECEKAKEDKASAEACDEQKCTCEEKPEPAPSKECEGAEKKPYHENDLPVINFLTKVLDEMGLDCGIDVKSNRDILSITIKGADSKYAIGYRGDTLDNLQFLCLLVANKNVRFKKKLIIDAEGYREMRTEQLTKLSKKLAIKVAKTNTAIELEPMNPFERRVIHTALQGDKYVTTSSEGDEPNRYVVISPVSHEVDMYDNTVSHNFKKSGIKTRSFGQKPKRF